jgi:hypothetical protein
MDMYIETGSITTTINRDTETNKWQNKVLLEQNKRINKLETQQKD